MVLIFWDQDYDDNLWWPVTRIMMIISGETIIPGWSSLGAITKTIKPRTSTETIIFGISTCLSFLHHCRDNHPRPNTETIIPETPLRQSSQGIRTGTYTTVYLDCCLVHLSVHQGYKILCTGCPIKMLTRCLCETIKELRKPQRPTALRVTTRVFKRFNDLSSTSQSTKWVDQIRFLRHQNPTWNTWDKNFMCGTALPS